MIPSLSSGQFVYGIFKKNYRGEIGFILHPDHWRKGIMKEAINAVVDYGFTVLGLHSIASIT
jgi:ribosomal-protein-alanine N-acetyltransferase